MGRGRWPIASSTDIAVLRDRDAQQLAEAVLEQLVRETCLAIGYRVRWSGKGADAGRDLLIEESGDPLFGRKTRNWLVSCKHNAHASGGKAYQGHLLKSRNKWLQWAFIEAAWVAVGCSSYFGGIYRAHRTRGKKANVAITIVARRMCRISFTLFKERRNFQEHNFPGRSARRLTAAAA